MHTKPLFEVGERVLFPLNGSAQSTGLTPRPNSDWYDDGQHYREGVIKRLYVGKAWIIDPTIDVRMAVAAIPVDDLLPAPPF